MKVEFDNGKIVVQADAYLWGPFNFVFTKGIPSDRTVISATCKSYLGRVKPADSDILSTFTETTSELVASCTLLTTNTFGVYFNRPTTAAYINKKHTLVFTFTLDAAGGGGTHTAFYYHVEVL